MAYQGTRGRNFNFLIVVFWEIHSVEDRFLSSPGTSLKHVFRVKLS
jgi:hypothetical protein